MVYRHYVTRSPAVPPISLPSLTQLQPLVSHIPSKFLPQSLCACFSCALNVLPLTNHMAHSLTSFRSLQIFPLPQLPQLFEKGVMSSPSDPVAL